MIDFTFYRLTNPKLAKLSDDKLLDHYISKGWKNGHDPSALFSVQAYIEQNPDVAKANIEPLKHYLDCGQAEGRLAYLSKWSGRTASLVTLDDLELCKDWADLSYLRAKKPEFAGLSDDALVAWYLMDGFYDDEGPSALFSTSFYLSTYPDIAVEGINPLLHYICFGRAEGRSATPQEASRRLVADMDIVRQDFDANWYRTSYQDIEGDDDALLAHYMTVGWKNGHDPSALFSVQAYIEQNPDVAKANIEPLKHYLDCGQAEGRLAYLSKWSGRTASLVTLDDLELCKDWADLSYLRAKKPEFAGLSDDALVAWYLMDGFYDDEGPSALFSTSFYLSTYPDIAVEGINPLLHYICFGRAEGRSATPQEASRRLVADMDIVRQDFDANWYRTSYQDIEGDDDALLAHYMTVGWKIGRDPSREFESAYYLDRYQDIAETGKNPFLHYIQFGRKEQRRCSAGRAVRLAYSADAKLTPDLPNTGLTTFKGMKARPPKTVDPTGMHIHWVVPDFTVGSGGHMTIFRMVRYLEQLGHHNTIWIERPMIHETERAAWETIVKYFQCVEADVRFVSDALNETSADVVIATGWSTAWIVKNLTGFKAQMYFVQDHEPEFYPTGSISNLAKQTYGFGLGCICASPWLEELMSKRYGRWAQGFYLAYDPAQYFVSKDAVANVGGPIKIAVYGRIHTDRRCVQLALAGLEILAQTRDDFEVHFFGQDGMPFSEVPFTALNHGILNYEQLAELYNECDIGICFSGTNYSLIPQEMMACGLPLIELNTESTRAIFPENTVTLAGPLPMDIAVKLGKLMDSPNKRMRQRNAALKWVSTFSWKASAQQVERTILDYLDHKGAKLAAPTIAKTKEILFDVVVPTWNGKSEFAPVLEALRSQRIADQIQIHCVDSSSSDGTIDWLKNQKDVSLTVIDQKDFQHGRTRNFGASLGSAPFIGFITQDATPATPNWAGDIVKMLRAVPDAAGLFGRHIAYPNHSLFVQEEITTHFENMLLHPLVLSKHTDPERWESGDSSWRQLLHFYSDNNSAMRRDVWDDIPYPEIEYGEDQVWARDIIEAGYSKIYAPTAAVYHSHDFDPPDTYKRAKTEGAFFYEFFGYELGNGSENEIAERVAREQYNMEIWGRRRRISDEEIAIRKANIAEKYRGWRDGRMGN